MLMFSYQRCVWSPQPRDALREGERGRGCPWENLVNQKSSEMRGNSLDTVLDGHGTNLRP